MYLSTDRIENQKIEGGDIEVENRHAHYGLKGGHHFRQLPSFSPRRQNSNVCMRFDQRHFDVGGGRRGFRGAFVGNQRRR